MQCPHCECELENQIICDEAQSLGMVDPDDPVSLVMWLLDKLSKGGEREGTKVATRTCASC